MAGHLKKTNLITHSRDDAWIEGEIIEYHRRRTIGEGFQIKEIVGVGSAFGSEVHQFFEKIEPGDRPGRIEVALHFKSLRVAPSPTPSP